MHYSVKLQSIDHARAECIEYLGGQPQYLKFVKRVAGILEGHRITVQYRRASFSCGMVGMHGYMITRAVFLDARRYIDDRNEAAPN